MKQEQDHRIEYEKWLSSPAVDDATKEELRAIENDEKAIEDRFSGTLKFGTAGLRGIMRAGINGVNVYTVRYATQALSEVIKKAGRESDGVVIACDPRINSETFSKEAASVLAANGIKVYLFDSMRPTPELSFAIRHLKAASGINITASHNTKKYNGYKAYVDNGAQVRPEAAAEISEEMEKLDIFDDVRTTDFDEARSEGLIEIIGKDVDEAYMTAVIGESHGREYIEKAGEDFSVVYTPFHGAGRKIVPEVLRRVGVKNIVCVEEQMIPDGSFPTVKSPNPENYEGFAMAIDLAEKEDIDLIIGTDPDSDRCGIVARRDGRYEILTGNQVGVLLLDHIIEEKKKKGTMPAKPAAVKSIVSTTMFNAICEHHGVKAVETLTGFKFIGGKMDEIDKAGEHRCIYGFEESNGYLTGDYARDKDGVETAMLISEIACKYVAEGKGLWDAVDDLYKKYGYFIEKTDAVYFEPSEAQAIMKGIMDAARSEHPREIGLPVERARDYLEGTIKDLRTGAVEPISLPKSNVLFYELEGGCAVIIRPSGTEPKIKLYVMVKGQSLEDAREKFDTVKNAAVKMLSA